MNLYSFYEEHSAQHISDRLEDNLSSQDKTFDDGHPRLSIQRKISTFEEYLQEFSLDNDVYESRLDQSELEESLRDLRKYVSQSENQKVMLTLLGIYQSEVEHFDWNIAKQLWNIAENYFSGSGIVSRPDFYASAESDSSGPYPDSEKDLNKRIDKNQFIFGSNEYFASMSVNLIETIGEYASVKGIIDHSINFVYGDKEFISSLPAPK